MAFRIMVLRGTLTDEQTQALQFKLPGRSIELFRSDPRTYIEHAENCRREKPDLIVLPCERPIPSLAMEEGFRHVVVNDKSVEELVELDPKFVPFELEK